ncbi:hypothetical protein P4U99_21190 [Brevibacillus agri]|uniref:coiled-coil domain-containing protein n=1 Tax=Brevibacillus agri TaxID=51101 RepID=UPI002E235375|nr:hypothetical protein [Brevibacillus agri]MED1652924.1 hypothetical protein [Brevibacillus agri]MED1687035.1 hypothetical protein [Brevibacillus agri]MED1691763.1 hypothetical protein [Brevibacillus agri]MED1698960.1 hypothetical protein [Brevibacillus agri]
MFTPKADNELRSLLEPVRRQLQKRVLLQQITQYGLWGAGGSALLLLAARLWPIPYYSWLAAALIPLALLLGGLVALRKKATLLQSAQAADGNGLAQRVETAWEHRDSTSSVAVMQREDALRHLRQNLPRIIESIHIWSGLQKKLYAAGGLLLASLLLMIWPNPQDGRLAQMALEKQAIAQAEKEIEEIKQETKATKGLSEAQKKQLEEMLEQAKKAMAKATDPAERLNALRAAEKQLEKLRAAAQNKAASLHSLQRSLGSQQSTKSLADALAKNDREALTAALQASMLQALAEAQQSQQAMLALAQAAASLHQSQMTLASAGAFGNNGAGNITPGAGQAVPAATTPGGNPAASGTGTTANANPNPAGNQQTPPANGNTGAGQGNGSTNGTGNAAGNGSMSGLPNGTGKGTSGTGIANGGNQGSGAGLAEGKHELVTVPSSRIGSDSGPTETVGGPLGAGPSQSQQSGNTQVTSGGTLPYEEVYGQYEQFARESMEKGSIPGDYQDIVKDYFSKIEP